MKIRTILTATLPAIASLAMPPLVLPSAAQARDYQVAIVQSLTGPVAFVGTAVRDGALLAIDELNKGNFLGSGNKLAAIVSDDGFERGQVVTVMQQAANNQDVLIGMGPTSGPIAMAGLAVANDRKLPTISTTNSLAAMQLGPYGFIMTSPPFVTIPVLAAHLADVLKVKNCAAI